MSLKSYLSPQAYRSYQAEKARRFIERVKYPQQKQLQPLAEWIQGQFYLYDTAQLMLLYDCQRRPLELSQARYPDGTLKYNTVLWSWPKKSAKSSVIAAMANYIASNQTRASVKLVANDLKQADSRVGMYLRESIKIAQQHGQQTDVTINLSGYKITFPNGAVVECVPIDPRGEAGGNDDLIVYSELWGWKSKAHQMMWSEMTLSPNKWGRSQRWIDTYAGIRGESPILEQLYETGVVNGVKVWDDLEVYTNDAARMLTVWVTKPMFAWQTPEYYAEQEATLTPSEFLRMHRNQWSEFSEAFIPLAWWEACRISALSDLARRGVVMGIDAAVENDCFAVVIVSAERGTVQVRYARVWTPPKGGQIAFAEIEEEIKRLFRVYNVIEVAYDPYQMASTAQRLGSFANWQAFTQGAPRLVADKMLYDLIRDRQIVYDAEYPDLQQHILNADRKPEEDKLRLIKRAPQLKIDACVALSMAANRVLAYNL